MFKLCEFAFRFSHHAEAVNNFFFFLIQLLMSYQGRKGHSDSDGYFIIGLLFPRLIIVDFVLNTREVT